MPHGIAGLAGPLVVAHAAIRILIDERPDGPALGILLFEVRRVDVAEAILAEDRVLPDRDVVAQAGEIDVAFVFADDRLGAGDHRGEERDEAEEDDEGQGEHRQLAAAEVAPGFAPEADGGRAWRRRLAAVSSSSCMGWLAAELASGE